MEPPEATLRLHTPATVRQALASHGLAARKSAGQNFVVDPNTVRKMVRDAGVESGDLVVEIGPGVGSLTLALVEAGARVVAIEVDYGLAAVLEGIVGERVAVVRADALDVDYAGLVARLGMTAAGPKLVANLPYNIATPLVVAALTQDVFSRLHVMVQREVGERWAARVGDPGYSSVSVKLAALADVRVVAAVPRSVFFPVPRVDSVTVTLDPQPLPSGWPQLFTLVDAGFRQRRKRLRNALSDHAPPAHVEAALRANGLDAGARAEELDLASWRQLAARLQAAAP